MFQLMMDQDVKFEKWVKKLFSLRQKAMVESMQTGWIYVRKFCVLNCECHDKKLFQCCNVISFIITSSTKIYNVSYAMRC